jgi:hypothetical protein
MAANNAIGTGALILSANADKMLADLDRVKAGADRATKQINAKAQAGGGAFAGGFLGSLAGKFLEAPIQKITETITEWALGTNRFRSALIAVGDAADLAARKLERGLRLDAEKLGAIVNPQDQLAEIGRQSEALKAMLADQLRIRDAARDWEAKLKDSTSMEHLELWAGGALDSSLELVKLKGDKATEAIGKLRDRLEDMSETSKRIKSPELDPKLIGDANRLAQSFELQRLQLGKTAEEAQIFALKMQGATDGMLGEATRQMELLKKARAENAPVQLAGALSKGSTEAYSLTAKFQAAGTLAEGQAKKQAAVGKETNRLLGLLLKEMTGVEVVKVG